MHQKGYHSRVCRSCSWLRVPLSSGFPSAEQPRSGAIPQVLITVVTSNAPRQICCLAVDDDGAAGGEHGAGPVDGLVGAAEPGGRGGGDHRCPSPAGRCGELQYSRPHRHRRACAAILALKGVDTGRSVVDNYRVIGQGVLCSVTGTAFAARSNSCSSAAPKRSGCTSSSLTTGGSMSRSSRTSGEP